MKISDLYNKGISFQEFTNSDQIDHIEETFGILNNIAFGNQYIEKIRNIDKSIRILVCAEIWCSDCRVNVPVLEKMKQYNGNIQFSIVNKDGNEEFFEKYSPAEKVRIPTFIVCEDDFRVLGTFIERPAKVKELLSNEDEAVRKEKARNYRKGQYTEETLKDILELIL